MKTDRCMGVSMLPVSTAPVRFYLRFFFLVQREKIKVAEFCEK